MNPNDMTMTMGSAVPGWVTPVAAGYLALSLLSTLVIATDIYLARRRHRTASSELVWVASALYLGPVAVWFYWRRGRMPASRYPMTDAGPEIPAGRSEPILTALLPGGSASAVAHVLAVPAVAALGWTIAGLAMWPMILVIAVVAIVLVALHEVATARSQTPDVTPVPPLSIGGALLAAALTVAAFDIGMVGWMLLLHYNDAMPAVDQSSFWFLMQVGVLVGLATGYPAVRWLLDSRRTGVPA